MKYFEEAENSGSEINYRCVNCRNCKICLQGNHIQYSSIKEEIEQDIIDQSITTDVQTGKAEAKLPFIENPKNKLIPNKYKALAIFNSELKQLNRNEYRKFQVMESEAKLQKLSFVDFVRNLTPEQQKKLRENPIQNFILCYVVWKENSISTPCRIMFNASLPKAFPKKLE